MAHVHEVFIFWLIVIPQFLMHNYNIFLSQMKCAQMILDNLWRFQGKRMCQINQ